MTDIVISVENLSKQYRLGLISGRTLRDDLARTWARLRGQPDPLLKIGQETHGSHKGETIWALRDVSFEVKRGEVVGIIGRNGAGKSTLLKILSRITAPTAGQVKVKGRVASLLEVGTGFHPELTGKENIYLNGAILGMKRAEIDLKFDEIVDFSGVEKFIATPVKRYSSGMYVRLAFAIAAHMEPELLVVDEVLAVGDAEFQKKCLGKMGDVAEEGRTVLFVSHNMAAVLGLCNRGIFMSAGYAIFDSEVKETVEYYLRSFVVHPQANGVLARNEDATFELVDLEFMDVRGQPVHSVMSGQDFIFRLLVRSREKVGPSIVSIGIDDNFGVRVSLLANTLVGQSISLGASNTAILCHISNLPLIRGEYTLSIKITGPCGVLIWCPNVVTLQVEHGDFFRSGKIIEASWMGSTLIHHTWDINSLS